MEKFPLLPPPILRSILGYAVPGYAEDLAPTKRTATIAMLKELESVGPMWGTAMKEMVRQYQQSALTLVFKTASSRELREIYATMEEQGRNATELYVSMGTSANLTHSRQFTLRPSLRGTVEGVYVDWERIFASLPALKVLNLAEMPLDSRHVLAALEAASTHCLKLESLTLPYAEQQVDQESVHMVLMKLYESLGRWRVDGNLGGLRRLSVPTRMSEGPFRSSEEFFENVMTNCPLVELLDGYKVSLFEEDGLTCADTWLLDLRDWERFNATCSQLREFHWVVAPFGDPYFRVFGEHVKPKLKKLSFGVAMNWNWRWYFHDKSEAGGEMAGDREERDFCERPDYGVLATDAKAALKGCPMLDELQVQLYHPVNAIVSPQIAGIPKFPKHEVVDVEAFGDSFCEALAMHCPFVSRFSIVEVAEELNTEDIDPIQTFTDAGLMALSRLTYLRSLNLRSVNCSGEGVFAFLNSLSSGYSGDRVFEIRVGGRADASRMKFYDVVKELLVKIAETSDLPCAERKFVLRLENCSYSSRYAVTPDYGASFLRELEQIMTRVKAAHPSLRQHVVTMDRTRHSFMRIAEFGLYSTHADPGIYAGWEDWEEERSNKGISLANHVVNDGDDDFPSDNDDSYDGYDDYDGPDEYDFGLVDISEVYVAPRYQIYW